MSANRPELYDILQGYSSSKYAKLAWSHGPIASIEEGPTYNLNPHFKLWKTDGNGINHPDDPNDYWIQEDYTTPKQAGTGYFLKPKDYEGVGIQTRKDFRYPKWVARAILPDPATEEGFVWMGFEQDRDCGTFRSAFRYDVDTDTLKAVAGSFGSTATDISDQLPSNYASELHKYSIDITRSVVEFRIDNGLVAVAVSGHPISGTFSSPPYAIICTKGSGFGATRYFQERHGPLDYEHKFDLNPFNCRVAEGMEEKPRSYYLYEAGTSHSLVTGTYDAAVSSQPVPATGLGNQTFLFRADTDSTTDGLYVEVYTEQGNWRTYGPSVETYSAGDLYNFILTGNVGLARLTYEPAASGASVTDAEVVGG